MAATLFSRVCALFVEFLTPCEKCGEPTADRDLCGDGYCRACHVAVTFESCIDGFSMAAPPAPRVTPRDVPLAKRLHKRIAAYGMAMCKSIKRLRPELPPARAYGWPTSGKPHCYECMGCGSHFATEDEARRCSRCEAWR